MRVKITCPNCDHEFIIRVKKKPTKDELRKMARAAEEMIGRKDVNDFGDLFKKLFDGKLGG